MPMNTTLRCFLTALLLFAGMHGSLPANEMWEELFKEHLENAEAGDTDAQYELGIMYLKGQGVAPDRDQALLWLQKSADAGNQQARGKLDRARKEQEKFDKLSKQAWSGDIDAQYQVGMMYLKGRGVRRSGAQAENWLVKAAEQGDARAITRLGIVKYKGEVGPADYPQALDLFNRVSSSSALAQYYLGEMYANGAGVAQDYGVAIGWYRQAAEGGFDRALGKIINLEEELRVQELRKQNVALVKSREQATLTQRKTGSSASSGNDRRTAPGKKTPVVIKVKKTALDRLAGQQWYRGGKPLEYLPSGITECDRENNTLVCLSKELTREQGVQLIRYRVKATIKFRNDEFVIVYRNLVLDVETSQEAGDQSGGYGYDDEVEHGFRVRTGWTQEHQVSCKPLAGGQLDCIKNRTHKMLLVSKPG